MVISTRVYIEHPDLALAHTIGSLPDAQLGVVSDAGTDPDNDSHFFWIEGADIPDVEATFDADHTVEDYTLIVEKEERLTYRIEYSEATKLITPAIMDLGGLTLFSRSHGDGWLLELQFKDHDGLYSLNEYAESEGLQFEVIQLQHDISPDNGFDFDLTESQRDALVTAFKMGYYDDPRESSLEELAAELGISTTAGSGLLRRGAARLIEDVLVEDDRD